MRTSTATSRAPSASAARTCATTFAASSALPVHASTVTAGGGSAGSTGSGGAERDDAIGCARRCVERLREHAIDPPDEIALRAEIALQNQRLERDFAQPPLPPRVQIQADLRLAKAVDRLHRIADDEEVRPSPGVQPATRRSISSYCASEVSWNSSTSRCSMRMSSRSSRSDGASGSPRARSAIWLASTKSMARASAKTSCSRAAARGSTSSSASIKAQAVSS